MKALTSVQRRALFLAKQKGGAPPSKPILDESEAVDTSALSLAWTERALLNKAEARDPREQAKRLRKSLRNGQIR